jgi:hypothetical protein
MLTVVPAAGQGFAARQCNPFPRANEQALRERYNERIVGMGITGGGWLAERWENTETGTWSLTVRSPDGVLCMLAIGEGWRTITLLPEGEAT